jgi:hypothetical protein
MRAYELARLAADGANDDEREAACIYRMAWCDDRCEGLEDSFGGFEGLVCGVCEEVFAGC